MSGEFHIDDGPVLLSMPPGTQRIQTRPRSCQPRAHRWYVFRGPDLLNRHPQELSPGIAVMAHCRVIYSQERERFEVEHPHGQRVALEQQSVTRFIFAQRLLRPLALGDVIRRSQDGKLAFEVNCRATVFGPTLPAVLGQELDFKSPRDGCAALTGQSTLLD